MPIATLPGMAERTLTVSSAGKTFSFTGWKIGWVTGPEQLVTAVRTVKQFLTYVSGAPFQPAIAFALGDPDVAAWVDELAALVVASSRPAVRGARGRGLHGGAAAGHVLRARRRRAARATRTAPRCAATCPAWPGWSACPVTAFTHAGSDVDAALRSWVRFTFVKRDDVLTQAVRRLHRLHT